MRRHGHGAGSPILFVVFLKLMLLPPAVAAPGVDYTIFLTTWVPEEAKKVGPGAGAVTGLAATVG